MDIKFTKMKSLDLQVMIHFLSTIYSSFLCSFMYSLHDFFIFYIKQNKTIQNSHILSSPLQLHCLKINLPHTSHSVAFHTNKTSATLSQRQVVTGGDFCAVSFWAVPQILQWGGPREAPSSFSCHQASHSCTYFDCTPRLSEFTTAPHLPCWITKQEDFITFLRKNSCHSQVEDVLKATLPPKLPNLWEGGCSGIPAANGVQTSW